MVRKSGLLLAWFEWLRESTMASLLGARKPGFSGLLVALRWSSSFASSCLYGLNDDLLSSVLILLMEALLPSAAVIEFALEVDFGDCLAVMGSRASCFAASVLPMLLHVAARRANGDFFCSLPSCL